MQARAHTVIAGGWQGCGIPGCWCLSQVRHEVLAAFRPIVQKHGRLDGYKPSDLGACISGTIDKAQAVKGSQSLP